MSSATETYWPRSDVMGVVIMLSFYAICMAGIGYFAGWHARGNRTPKDILVAIDEIQRSERLIVQCQRDLINYAHTIDSLHTWLHVSMDYIDD